MGPGIKLNSILQVQHSPTPHVDRSCRLKPLQLNRQQRHLMPLPIVATLSLSLLAKEDQVKAHTRPLSINGTKNNAKELDQRIRIDQASVTLMESLRRPCIAEDGEWLANAFSAWPALRLCFKRKGFYASFTASALSTDSSGSCSVSSGSRNGWKAP